LTLPPPICLSTSASFSEIRTVTVRSLISSPSNPAATPSMKLSTSSHAIARSKWSVTAVWGSDGMAERLQAGLIRQSYASPLTHM
jgi:hypothetical protein